MLVKQVRDELATRGWTVEEDPEISIGRTFTAIDLLARKGNEVIAIECKPGQATASHLGVLKMVRAGHKLIVATGWADQRLASEAKRLKIELVQPDKFANELQTLETDQNAPV